MKSLHLILVLFSIASMFTSFGVYDVDATHNGNGKSMGCEKANPTNNPHCNETSPPPNPESDADGDGIPDFEDACPLEFNYNWRDGEPDHDGDGRIDSRDNSPCSVV